MATDRRATTRLSDVRSDTRRTHEVRDQSVANPDADTRPRDLVGASWQRVRANGLDPSAKTPEIAPLPETDVQARRERSRLRDLLPQLRAHLRPAGEAVGQALIVTDADGRVLWRDGGKRVSQFADRLGMVGGSAWTEASVGTNAIGTCIVTGAPVHIHGGEHYAQMHTVWTCAAAPLHDPVTGKLLGVVDLSGPSRTGNANMLSLVTVAARLAEVEVRAAHLERLNELRSVAAPVLAKVGGKAVAIAPDGTTAAVTGFAAPEQIALPSDMPAGEVWLPTLGRVLVDPLPGGWLLRVQDDDSVDDGSLSTLVLDLSGTDPELRVNGPGGDWKHRPSPRHAEILLALVRHRDGRSASELAVDLFAEGSRTVTVRAEVSRLRRTLGPLLQRQPYRFADGLDLRLVLPERSLELLPESSAPVVAAVRGTLAP
ncbi:MAG: GAF domain-containing protein [Actinomycetia bacterium]|nr:GAF domain-containing protein [Actinomycetes bacterium]